VTFKLTPLIDQPGESMKNVLQKFLQLMALVQQAIISFVVISALSSTAGAYEIKNFQLIMDHNRILPPQETEVGTAHFNSFSTGVIVFKDPNGQNNFFNVAAKKNGIETKIENCSLLIDTPVETAGGNHSYGGMCTVSEKGKELNAMVCGDIMVGRFQTQETKEQDATLELLVKFVITNCYGG
jgi:hypothetical protein